MRYNKHGIAVAGLRRWYNDDRHIFQDCSGPRCHLVDQFGAVFDERGATFIAGNNGKWAAMLQSVPVQSFSSFGYASDQGFIWDISHDGTIVECPDYQDGRRVRLLDQPNTEIYAPAGIVCARAFKGGFVATSYDRRIYHSSRGWINTPDLQPFDCAVTNDGRYIAFHTHSFLFVLDVNLAGLYGMKIGDAPTFYPDIVLLDSIRVGWSVDSSDTRYRWIDIDPNIPMGDLSGYTDWPDPVVYPPPTVTIKSYDQEGAAPFDCHAVAEVGGGPSDLISWLLDGLVDGTSLPTETTHVYRQLSAGSYRIGARITGPGGSDETATPRVVSVHPAKPSGGTFVQSIQLSEPSYLNWRYGGGQSLEPPTAPDDSDRRAFEHGREVAGADETAQLFKFSDGTYGIQSPNGRSWLSIQPEDGTYEEREVGDGEPGPYERFVLHGNVLTSVSHPDTKMVHP